MVSFGGKRLDVGLQDTQASDIWYFIFDGNLLVYQEQLQSDGVGWMAAGPVFSRIGGSRCDERQ